jgi:glycerol-1-phosphate dehydrogenase [NAD(P)+]
LPTDSPQPDLLALSNKKNCICGKNHSVPIEEICFTNQIEKDLTRILSIELNSNKHGLMICDLNTYTALGNKIEIICKSNRINMKTCMFHTKEILVPDEKALGTILMQIDALTGCILGVGAGTINDLARFMAFKFSIPFISIPTAPSVDGFASSVAALIIDGQKITFPAKAPKIIIADIPTLVLSPIRMKAAGLGDLLGKFTCQLDWSLSKKLRNEPYCAYTTGLVQQAVEDTLQAYDPEDPYNERMVDALIRGLILSGLAIAMDGTSRPASNSEHHLSHYFELMALNGKAKHFLHGETVALGLWLSSKLYHVVFDQSFDDFLKLFNEHKNDESEADRIKLLKTAFYPTPDRYIENWKRGRINEIQQKERLASLKSIWIDIQSLIKQFLGKQQELEKLMVSTSITFKPEAFGFSKELITHALIGAKEIRERYTILAFLDELSILPYYVEKIINECG